MCKKYTPDELNTMTSDTKDDVIYQMQDRLGKLEQDYENLIEQVRLANQQRFGRHSEKLADISGQMSFFNEAEYYYSKDADEPSIQETILAATKKPRKPKMKGQREEDLKDFPHEEMIYDVPKEKLVDTFGENNWKHMADDISWKLRFEPAKWIAEKHIVKVYVGIDGLRQDEFLRGDHPTGLLRGSIVTSSLEAAIINGKYVNANPLDRLSRDFQTNGLNLSKQTMSNWTINIAERYLVPVYEMMRSEMLKVHVNQSDETTLEVIHDGRSAGSKSYMWIHITGELSECPRMILYEYQKTRHSDHPRNFYKDFNGIVMTDGLEQYHKLDRELEGFTNANCYAHARRNYANAIKAMGKDNQKTIKRSTAYQALVRIGAIYDLEGSLKELSAEERLKERHASIKPLVEEYFAWVKERLADTTCVPKGETAKGLNYSVNQESYMKVFLTDGEVPIDNSACERAIRNFTVGRKNWVTINTIRGAQASAMIYSITETARANNLNVYYYIKYLLDELPERMEKNGNIEKSKLKPLMPWSKELPAECQSKRRQ